MQAPPALIVTPDALKTKKLVQKLFTRRYEEETSDDFVGKVIEYDDVPNVTNMCMNMNAILDF